MKKSGYKMKGSPMQRNFGISPLKNEKTSQAMKDLEVKVRDADFAATNRALVEAGKDTLTRPEYDKSVGA